MAENLSLLYQGLSDVATILARRVAVEFSDSDDGPSDSEYDSDDWGKDPKKYSPLICLLSRCEGTSPSLCPVLTFPLEGLNLSVVHQERRMPDGAAEHSSSRTPAHCK